MTGTPQTPATTVQRISEITVQIVCQYGCGYEDEITEAAIWAYETFVQGYDIPGIPAFIEVPVERAGLEFLKMTIKVVFGKLKENCPIPHPAPDPDPAPEPTPKPEPIVGKKKKKRSRL